MLRGHLRAALYLNAKKEVLSTPQLPMKQTNILLLAASVLAPVVQLYAQVQEPLATVSATAGRHCNASRHRCAYRLRTAADAQRQRYSAAAVFAGAKLYRAESSADFVRLEPLHDRLRFWGL